MGTEIVKFRFSRPVTHKGEHLGAGAEVEMARPAAERRQAAGLGHIMEKKVTVRRKKKARRQE